MKVEYYKEYSPCLKRDMEFKVYGHAGTPILVFPTQNGRFYDFENNGMVATVEGLIDNGNIQLFCCDSIDLEHGVKKVVMMLTIVLTCLNSIIIILSMN